MTIRRTESAASPAHGGAASPRAPTATQLMWLRRGVAQPGGKLPLFDGEGRRISQGVVASCLKAGWAEPWFHNPLKPDWKVCRLTEAGRTAVASATVIRVDFRARRRPVPPPAAADHARQPARQPEDERPEVRDSL